MTRRREELRVHFSSATCEWPTPQALYNELADIFGGFTLDPCATEENAKCVQFFTKEQDGLMQPWEGKVFMNPPYGRQIGLWVKKAWEESLNGALVVCLLPRVSIPLVARLRQEGPRLFPPWPPEIRARPPIALLFLLR